MSGSLRFGVLLCAADSEYVKEKYGGYFGIFTEMLGEDGETWDEYRPFAGELPRDDVIGNYDGFVVTGSCSDAHGDDAWILDLLAFLKKLVSMKKKVLGICFGHQVISSLYIYSVFNALYSCMIINDILHRN